MAFPYITIFILINHDKPIWYGIGHEPIWGFIKNPSFNHIFGRDRILSAWYRGIKNAGPRKRAQGRAQDIPYQSISPYHHGIWRIFIECGKKTHARKSAQGRSARGPTLPKSNRNFRQPPFDLYESSIQPALDDVISKESYHAIDLRCANHTPVLSIGEGVVREIAETHKYLGMQHLIHDLFGNCWSRRYEINCWEVLIQFSFYFEVFFFPEVDNVSLDFDPRP